MIGEMAVALVSLGKCKPLQTQTETCSNQIYSFETRDVCDEIIKNFNNTVVKKPGGEDHVIQIRFSDTHEQKLLKQQTAAARQFRAAEFEYGCAQALRTGVLPPQSAERLHSVIGNGVALPAVGNDFKNYLQQQPVNK